MHWLIAHFIGDWFLQNDWIALYKKGSTLRCLLHTLIYLIPFLFTGIPLILLPIIGLQHFVIDRSYYVEWYVKKINAHRFDNTPLWPWAAIVIDNLMHIIFIHVLLIAYTFFPVYGWQQLGYFAVVGFLAIQPYLYNTWQKLKLKFLNKFV